MADTNRNANVSFSVRGADQSKQDLEKIRTAAEGIGTDGKQAAQGLVDAFANIEKASDRVATKISEGRVVGVRDGNLLIQQFTLLKESINSAFGSIENAPAEIQQAYKKAETQFETTTAKIKTLTTATTENKQAVAGNAAQWGGFEQQLLKLAGADGVLGKLTIGIVGVAAAFKEGIQIGTTFAEAIGTNFSAAESSAQNLKSAVKSVTNAIVTDGIIDGVKQWTAVQMHLGDTITAGGKELEGYNLIVGQGVDRAAALAVSNEDLKKAVDIYALAQQGGTAGLKLFNDAVNGTDPSKLGKALTDLVPRFKELAGNTQIAKEKQEELTKAQEAAIGTIKATIQALQNEITARKEGITAAEQQIEKYKVLEDEMRKNDAIQAEQEEDLGGVTLSMRTLLQEMDKLLPAYEQHTARIKNAADALKKLLETNESLTPEEKERIKRIEEQIESYDSLTPVQKMFLQQMIEEILRTTEAKAAAAAHAAGLDKLVDSHDKTAESAGKVTAVMKDGKVVITNTTEEVKKSTVEWDSHTKTMTNVAASQTKAKGTLTDFGDSVKKGVQVIIDYNAQIIQLDSNLKNIAQSAEDAARAIRSLDDAASHATGGKAVPPQPGNSYPGVTEGT